MGLAECREIYNKIEQDKRDKAIQFLCNYFMPHEFKHIDNLIHADPEKWFAIDHFHFGGGMFVRNLLRINQFGEQFFDIDNLDDIYVELIEDAIKLWKNNQNNSQILDLVQ